MTPQEMVLDAALTREIGMLTRMVERSEREVYLLPCPCVDSTGRYQCGQPATVTRLDWEIATCLRCFKERP